MNHTKLSPGDRQRVKTLYAQGQHTQAALATKFKCHESTIRRAIHDSAPGETVPYWLHRRISVEDMSKLRARIAKCSKSDESYADLAREYKVSRTYISKIARRMGIKTQKKRGAR